MSSIPGSRRRAVNRSSEDCYASPSLPSIESSSPSSGPSPSPKRQKRSSGSSADSDESMGDIRVEDFRVGGPYLCALPTLNFALPEQHPIYRKWKSGLERGVVDLLNHHSIHWQTLDLVDRRSARYDDDGKTETVIVPATRDIPDRSWLNACLDIRNLFQLHNLPTLNIEIIDPRASAERYTFPVFEDDKIYPKWHDLSARICELIGMEGWLSLECFEEAQLLKLYEATFVRTTDMDLTSVVLPDNAWEQKAQLGMSIGPHGSDYSGSTFGGFLQLLHPSTKQWNTFGLTCYHCVDSEEGSNDSSRLSKDVKEWRETGMRVDQAKSALIDQPALKDHMKRMELIKEATENWMKSPVRERIEAAMSNNEFITPTDEARYKRFQDNINQLLTIKHKAENFFATGDALLGRVFAASGYRFTPCPMRRQLDWALIEVVTPRIGSNNMPPTGSYRDEFADFSGQLMEQPSVNDPPHGSALYKIGRRTNFTSGRYQGLHSVHLESWKTDKNGKKTVVVTEEEAVTRKNGLQFCAQGDSGSFIFDVEMKFVGLLFAGNMETGVGYFTPAAILFEDIKAMTGALEVRLPLS
ncbi:conserved hypothetical protein [Histoplasma capsulatum H143]|uniref:Uncharacterized protein n=1 Tax=Ajellomyces capsulatus (strain H143) TaxID=544712 RepID=C6H8U6_AJECH|nr:conserved hypothetical protein [Histoplasma capsulatum H143]